MLPTVFLPLLSLIKLTYSYYNEWSFVCNSFYIIISKKKPQSAMSGPKYYIDSGSKDYQVQYIYLVNHFCSGPPLSNHCNQGTIDI